MADDWDLFAVVRSCSSAANNTANLPSNDFRNDDSGYCHENPLPCFASLKFEDEDHLFSFPNPSPVRRSGFLHDSYKPFLPYVDLTASTNQGMDPNSLSSVFGGSNGQHYQYQKLQQQQQQEQPTTISIGVSPPFSPNQLQPQPQQRRQQQLKQQVKEQQVQKPDVVLPFRNVQSQAPRSRKRKNQQKRIVCHVTADNLTSDPWAWRKYGQKPIKGSSFPRNYYRCSSSKGCPARKQVERSNSDLNIFIITYTGEHTHPRPTHRNSLAGSTRNKLLTVQKAATNKDSSPETLPDGTTSCSSPRSVTSLSPISPISPTTPLSAPEDVTAHANNASDNGGEEESIGMGLETALDGESDEGDDFLIHNVHVDEDLFEGFDELVGDADAVSTSSRLGRNQTFGDNISSWGAGSSAAAGASYGGGGI